MARTHWGQAGVYLYPLLNFGARCFTPRPLHPGKKTRYPLYTRLGGPWGRYGWIRKISPPAEFEARTVQPAASRYSSPPKLFTYEKIIVFVLRTSAPLPREGEGVGKPYAAKTSRRIISVSKKLKAHVLFSNSVICNADPSLQQPPTRQDKFRVQNNELMFASHPRSVYERFRELHLFNMSNHVFAVTYLKHFKFVIIHCGCWRSVSVCFTEMENSSRSVNQHWTE